MRDAMPEPTADSVLDHHVPPRSPRLRRIGGSLALATALVLGGCTTTTGSTGTTANAGGGGGGGNDATGAQDAGNDGAGAAVQLLSNYPLNAQFPEGGAYDVSGKAFFVGSIGDGSVHRVAALSGAESTYFEETADGKWWTLGMDVDDARRRLWVCAMDDRSPDPRAGWIWVFDLNTGERIANHPLSKAAADATCTDVVVGPDGDAYVVDREQPNVYRVSLTDGAALFATDPVLKGTIAGQNAVVLLPDASALLSVVYTPPTLVRIDLADASVRKVTIHGPFTDDALLGGADGMDYRNGSVYVAFTSKLVRVIPRADDWAEGDATSTDVASGMTAAIHTPDGLFLLNGQSIRFALEQETDPFALVRYLGAL